MYEKITKMWINKLLSFCILIISVFGEENKDSKCVAVEGPGVGKPCIFPFTYLGKEYHECTTYNAPDKRPWCSTEVDEIGMHQSNTYGVCGEGCPSFKTQGSFDCKTTDGQDCLIPFDIDQFRLFGCVREDRDSEYRCPIKNGTEEAKFATIKDLKGVCSDECPKGGPLLADQHISMKQIFHDLKEYGSAYTAVPEGVDCKEHLQMKYEAEVLNGPKKLTDLHEEFCKSLCKLDKETCKMYASSRIRQRRNKPGDVHVSKSDCELQCATTEEIAAALETTGRRTG